MNCGTVVADVSDRTRALLELARLEHALEMNIKIGDGPPGKSQAAVIKARIAELRQEIETGGGKS
jgi:hypothetical protein